MTDGCYYVRLPGARFAPTEHAHGAWNDHEQHMGPVSGLIAQEIERHDPRPDLALGRITYEVLGLIPAETTAVHVETLRAGRTIELVEATLTAGDRTVVRARAWRIARGDTGPVAGGAQDPMPPPESWPVWEGASVWKGGYIASVEIHTDPASVPGRGRVWMRTGVTLVEGIETSPTAAYIGLVDTANGIAVREDPREWIFPNLDLSIHLHREPSGPWVGLDTTVVFGSGGIGLTSSVLHDVEGPVGRAEQILTVRRLPGHSPG